MERQLCIAVLTTLIQLWNASIALGCTTCEVGDRTAAAMGMEPPYRNRVRTGAQIRWRSDTIGQANQDRLQLKEEQFLFFLAWAPTDNWMLSALVPLSRRRITHVNLARSKSLGFGDLDVRARRVLYRDRRFETRHLLTLTVGFELPTAQQPHREHGVELPLELQAGSASLDPLAGLSYRLSIHPLSFTASQSVIVPTRGRFGVRQGIATLYSVAGQIEPASWLGLSAGLSGRTSA
ncbi:MAG: hypothetical protein AAF550_01780, partial [Myxococcota bacterium]